MGKLPDKSSEILPGQTDRSAVRNKLGNPFLASRYWHFDLFLESFSETELGIFMMFPVIPVPLGDKQTISRYTLVSYDEKGTVNAFQSGLFPGRGMIAEKKPILQLQAEDLTLKLEFSGQILGQNYGKLHLSVAHAKRDVFLQLARAASTCTAVVGDAGIVVEKAEGLQFFTFAMDEEVTRWIEKNSLAVLSLVPGDHVLVTKLARNQSWPFSCVAGEILYFHITYDRRAKKEDDYGLKVERYKDLPESFVNRPFSLYYQYRFDKPGEWNVIPEPGN